MSTESTPLKLQIKTLHRAASYLAYQLYRAGLEWELTDPILIHDRKDLKSESKWQNQIQPYQHQVKNLISFCRRLPVTLLADDVGLGKTISAGLVASELMSRGRVAKILIVCPKLLRFQWKEELQSKFGISGIPAIGRDLLTVKVPEGGGAVITTYHTARLYLDELGSAGFDMLILDEAHKLRNLYGVDPAPKVAVRFRQALADRMFKYVLMLTATPIQNRLWDIYSLVDLLTVAKGHENPFGTPGIFARNYISDDPDSARRLNPRMRDEFQSIVYRYMSRVRRADANLHFPERVVQLHKVEPSEDELELIRIVGTGIQDLNRLAQISILQALTSSPHALNTQLKHMAEKKTVPQNLSIDVDRVVQRGNVTAKLRGLATLVDKLRTENPQGWRMVVFTTRIETQNTIEAFLRERSIKCGLINGQSGGRNQDTIAAFKKQIPGINVIISTEAGSEGVNLQAANVLVNYDLPWNPMIVEQRIGRVQRLASAHATVCIFNIILRGTFEEYIVGRLMEKLQMASQAIGDLEALLSASGVSEEEEDAATTFEEKIRQLVVSSLAGADTAAAVRLEEKSIAEAKIDLEAQEKNIDAMFGEMDGASTYEAVIPDLPATERSKDFRTFVLEALASLGTHVTEHSPDTYAANDDGKRHLITFNETQAGKLGALFYGPGTPAFSRLASRITSAGSHLVADLDDAAATKAENLAQKWVESFGGRFVQTQISDAERSFVGSALLRTRATVAHDSYERLVDVTSGGSNQWGPGSPNGLAPLANPIRDPAALGIDSQALIERACADSGISEFCKFYTERRSQELSSAGTDARKLKKIEDDFTPRLEVVLVGLQGVVLRRLALKVSYEPEPGVQYESDLKLIPARNEIVSAPAIVQYSKEGRAPSDCLGQCAISKRYALRNHLVKSAISERVALPEFTGVCTFTGQTVLEDELGISELSGKRVIASLLKTSAITGKCAEPDFFGRCEFTAADVLKSELTPSQISGKKYRIDEQSASAVSGKTGHKSEFVICSDTDETVLPEESETCEVTAKIVRLGTLERCEVTGKAVLPSQLEKSVASGRKALRKLFVTSSISGARLLEEEAVVSATSKYCLPREAKLCTWSGKKFHPDDLRSCQLTGVAAHYEYMTTSGGTCLEALVNLLRGVSRRVDKSESWPELSSKLAEVIESRMKIVSSELSPSGKHLALCLETKNWLGLNVRHAGLVFSTSEGLISGRVVVGKRGQTAWKLEKTI